MGWAGKFSIIVVTVASAFVGGAATPAAADDLTGFSGCESVPIFGIDPYIRKICDEPIQPDGTWDRYQQRVESIGKWVMNCNSATYIALHDCPAGLLERTWYPTVYSDVDVYTLTVDTIPPGEPGHLDNPIRCKVKDTRCDPM